MRLHHDLDILSERHKKAHQAFQRKLPEVAAQHFRYIRLLDAEQLGGFALFYAALLHEAVGRNPTSAIKAKRAVLLDLLQNVSDSPIRATSSFEPGRICMIASYSHIASSRLRPMLDACVAL
jgi:hypothetical protein